MGVAERKERDKLARRRDILDAARECFFKNGFENTTIQQIAERVELSAGTLYLYFRSKEEIYISTFEDGLDILVTLFDEALDTTASGPENIESLCRAFIEFHRSHGQYLEILAFMRFSSDRTAHLPEDLQTRLQARVETCYDLVERALQAGIDAGELRSANPRDMARVLWSVLTGAVLMHERQADETTIPPLEELIRLAVSFMLDGMRLPAGQPATSS